MKKVFVLALAIMLTLCFGAAVYATGWEREPETKDDGYEIIISKLERITSKTGDAYILSPNAVASINTVVYFSVEVYDGEGQRVNDADIKLTDLETLYTLDNGVVAAMVTGCKPAVSVKIENVTPINELYWNDAPIIIEGDTVTIDALTFTRKNNVVTGVKCEGNLLELTKALDALGMSIEDVYNGKIYMSDTALIRNFGKCVKVEANAKWYNEITNVTLPQTGDASIVPYALSMMGVGLGILTKIKKSKH